MHGRNFSLRVIVDHVGGPLRIGRYAACLEHSYIDWKNAIERLARCPNVSMKLGGLGMRYLGLPGRDSGGDSYGGRRGY